MKRSSLLLSLLGFAALSASALAESYYVDPARGNDAADGSQAAPFKTIARAVRSVDGKGGEIHLAPATYREPIVIKKGGLPDAPLIVDGHGAVINLGGDVTKGPWIKQDDGSYVLDHVFAKPLDLGNYQTAPVFVNGLPVLGDHPKGPEYAPRLWHKGYIRLDDQKRLVLTFPDGLNPENAVVVIAGIVDLTGEAPGFSSAVRMESAQNVVVRNVTSAFSTNDGFNFHGSGKNIRLEKVKAIFNADEGMSAHEDYQINVFDSETAFNGSQGGGIQDIERSMTNYTNHRSHQNRSSGFQFDGGTHRVENAVSYGNLGYNLPKPRAGVTVELVNCQDKGGPDKVIPKVADPSAPFDAAKNVEESDRLGRFLQVRPASAY